MNQKGVYLIENTVTGDKYVGSSVRVTKRLNHHLNSLRRKKHSNPYLQNAFEKYGETAFAFRTLEETSDVVAREQYYIDTLRPSYNILKVAYSPIGYTHSEEAKHRIGDAQRGALNHNFGKTTPPDVRAKISKASLGRTISAETRHRIGLAHKGKTVSKETRSKLAAASHAKPVECVLADGSVVRYSSGKEAARAGFDATGVWMCCVGRLKTHRGCQWRYAK